jgi:hypothetical protein
MSGLFFTFSRVNETGNTLSDTLGLPTAKGDMSTLRLDSQLPASTTK